MIQKLYVMCVYLHVIVILTFGGIIIQVSSSVYFPYLCSVTSITIPLKNQKISVNFPQ